MDLSSIISSAKQQIKNSTGASSRSITQNLSASVSNTARNASGLPSAAINNATHGVTTTANQVVGQGINSINSALNSLAHGDFSQAFTKVSQAPNEMFQTINKAFGLNRGTKLTSSGQGTESVLSGLLSRADPVLGVNWFVSLADITTLDGSVVGLPQNYIEEVTPSFRTFEVLNRFYQGRQQHFPGQYSVDALRISCYADEDNVSLNYLLGCQNAILKPISASDYTTSGGSFGLSSGYKKPISVYIKSSDQQYITVLTYTECWIQALDSVTLVSNNSERLVYHATFQVGDVFPTLYKRK